VRPAPDQVSDALVAEGSGPSYEVFGVACANGYAELTVAAPWHPPEQATGLEFERAIWHELWDWLRRGALKRHDVSPSVWDEFQNRERRSLEASARRARKRLRLHINTCQLDHLLTLTTRESRNDPSRLWQCWDLLRRALIRARGKTFDYAAVIEDHPTNPDHRHIHVAIRGFQDVSLVRRLWRDILHGQGIKGGNIDVKRRSTRKLGQYLAKYLGKTLGELGQSWRKKGKRRYSVSRLEADRRPRRFRHYLEATDAAGMQCAVRKIFSKVTGWFRPRRGAHVDLWACGQLARACVDSS
jgi:hypothetical protein